MAELLVTMYVSLSETSRDNMWQSGTSLVIWSCVSLQEFYNRGGHFSRKKAEIQWTKPFKTWKRYEYELLYNLCKNYILWLEGKRHDKKHFAILNSICVPYNPWNQDTSLKRTYFVQISEVSLYKLYICALDVDQKCLQGVYINKTSLGSRPSHLHARFNCTQAVYAWSACACKQERPGIEAKIRLIMALRAVDWQQCIYSIHLSSHPPGPSSLPPSSLSSSSALSGIAAYSSDSDESSDHTDESPDNRDGSPDHRDESSDHTNESPDHRDESPDITPQTNRVANDRETNSS